MHYWPLTPEARSLITACLVTGILLVFALAAAGPRPGAPQGLSAEWDTSAAGVEAMGADFAPLTWPTEAQRYDEVARTSYAELRALMIEDSPAAAQVLSAPCEPSISLPPSTY